MIVQSLDLEDKADGDAFLALDSVKAGVCDRVLVMREGGFMRIIFNNNIIPIEAVITAVIDGIDIKND